MSGPRRDEPRPHPDLSRLEALIERIRAIKDGLGSEQATREVAVNPIIGELGWDTLNPEEVAREFSVLGGKVDYCLRTPTRDLVLIEVKRAGVDLDEHEKQLLRYAFDEGVPLGALTNGLAWWLYLPRAEGSWTQRRFSRIDLLEQDSASVASVLHRFRNHDGLVNGSALQEAQREFDSQERDRRLRAALHESWLRMLSDPESLLRAELSETAHEISGHVPDKQMLDEFLADALGNENVDFKLPPVRRRRSAPVVRPARTEPGASQPPQSTETKRSPGTRPSAFWLDGKRHEVTSWRWMMVRVCELLAKESGQSFPEHVAVVRGKKNAYFSSSKEDLRTPIQISGLNFFVEGNVSAATATRVAKRTLAAISGSDRGFRVELEGEVHSDTRPTGSKEGPSASAVSGATETFTGLRPVAFWLDGDRHEVARWNEILHGVCDRLAREVGRSFSQKVAPLRGRRRLYFSKNADDLRRPRQVGESSLYVERNLSANRCVRVAHRVLIAVRGSDEGFRVEVQDPHDSH